MITFTFDLRAKISASKALFFATSSAEAPPSSLPFSIAFFFFFSLDLSLSTFSTTVLRAREGAEEGGWGEWWPFKGVVGEEEEGKGLLRVCDEWGLGFGWGDGLLAWSI